jgi:hypothetical protein
MEERIIITKSQPTQIYGIVQKVSNYITDLLDR